MKGLQDEIAISFPELEKILFRQGLKRCAEMMSMVLEELDELVMQKRDPDRYKVKGKRTRELDTLMGKMEFERRYYYDTHTGQYVALLDQLLGLEGGLQGQPGA